jgi:hypothetical protein
MTRIARAIVMVLLLGTVLGSSGCITVWTETYAEFPPSFDETPPAPPQGNPSDG